MADLNSPHFKTGSNVDFTEIHTATFDISAIEFTPTTDYPYAHITPTTTRVGTVDANGNVNDSNQAIVSARAYAPDTSFVDFDISLVDGSFNLLIRPGGGEPATVVQPTDDLTASYVRDGTGLGSTHMMTSAGCLNTYTRQTFHQMFRAEETGTLSKIKINEDFVKAGSDVGINICKMAVSGSGYMMVDRDVDVLPEGSTDTREKFTVPGTTDISCITFDASDSGFPITQNSLYMMTFDGSFCDMGKWSSSDTSMPDMSGNSVTGYVKTDIKPYPVEVTVKSTSVSGKTDSGALMTVSGNAVAFGASDGNIIPHINAIYNDAGEYDIIMGFMSSPEPSSPYPVMMICLLMRIRRDIDAETFHIEGVRAGSYGNKIPANFQQATTTIDRILTKTSDGSTALIMSYFDNSTNEFKLIRYMTDDLLYHPPVFDDDGLNSNYKDAIGDHTMWGFSERLVSIGRSIDASHTIPYDGDSNSGMRMACDAERDEDNQWVVYTDLRYATNTDANAYMVNMSADEPNNTLFHIPLRNPLPKADLSYRYFLATFPTISMCGEGDVRHVSVGRNVYAYDTRANTVTFVGADISVYRADVDASEASYVGTVDMDGTEMPGFSQYVDLSGGTGGTGGVPYLHYTVTDVSGAAWGATALSQPLNNQHLFQDAVLYDVSNVVLNARSVNLTVPPNPTDSTPFHADVSGNLNVSGDCYANNFVARHTDVNSVNVNHSLWANQVEAASISATSISATSISIGGVELTGTQLKALIRLLSG